MLGVSEQAVSTTTPTKPKLRPTLSAASLAVVDTTLSSAVAALVHHLTQPLSSKYPHSVLLQLRSTLTDILTALYEKSWQPTEPSLGTGFRSLICSRRYGLPRPLKQAAKRAGVDAELWRQMLKGKLRDESASNERERDEWEAWCDPGLVCWRYGEWTFFDAEFDPIRPVSESIITIWQAGPSGSETYSTSEGINIPLNITPARPSAAIAIRAPSVSFIPPTPAHASGATVPGQSTLDRPLSPNLMPAASIGARPSHFRSTSIGYMGGSTSPISEEDESLPSHARASTYPTRSGHRHSAGSSSSFDSTISDSNSGNTQLLTPASRPGSADPFTAAAKVAGDETTPTPGGLRGRDPSPSSARHATPTAPGPNGKPPTPAVTPYDGGNVTVLGGGVKLGGGPGGGPGSRPGSVVSQHRIPMADRSRSPSISLASRALNSVLTPGEMSMGTSRKARTRRRIMPTYLGYVGQPGIGGPVLNAFQPMIGKGGGGGGGQPGQPQPGNAQPQGMHQGGSGWQPGMIGGVRQPLTRIA